MNKNIIYKLLVFVVIGLFSLSNSASAQKKGTLVSATVVDEQGNPLGEVNIKAPNGNSKETDIDGNFSIKIPGNALVLIEKEGYESQILSVNELTNKIVLNKYLYQATAKDIIKLGIGTKYKREMVGAVSSITPQDHLTYDNTQWVRDYIDGLMIGVKGSDNIRGLGSALFVIDGVIGRSPNNLLMEEVDQITVLKDANGFALYGSQARNGVIIINTKRGEINERNARVNVRFGVREPISLPKYLGSADYMEMYNEARLNDGNPIIYDDPDKIENYRSGTNPYRYPSVDFYSDDYLRSYTNTANVLAEFSGGNDKTQYYVNMGWNYNQSLVKLNPDANKGGNRFNVRGNIDFKVNSWIKSSVDVVAVISSNKTALEDLLQAGTTFKPNYYSPLLPVSMVDTMSVPGLTGMIDGAKTYNGMLLGGSQAFQDNVPVASTLAGGYRNSMFRSSQFNNSIDFDLDMITEGLSAKTYLSFDLYDAYNITVQNQYRIYDAKEWLGDDIIELVDYGEDQRNLTENVASNGLVTRIGFYGLLNYQKTFNENHGINATFLGYVNSQKQVNKLQSDKSSHLGMQLSYDYKKKLYVDFSAAYVHSNRLPEGNRGGLSPTGGIAYILSEEDFMKDINFINFLKLKATAGIVKSDMSINDYYLYDETYATGKSFNWADGGYSNRAMDISQGGSTVMTFEERVDLNVGFESYLLNSIGLEFNYFKSDIDRQLTTLNTLYPSYYSEFRPYDNYNKDSYEGFELGVDYLKKINNLSVKLGGNIMYAVSEVAKRDEINEYEYQNKTGRPTDAIYGLVDYGLYSEEDFTNDIEGNYILNDDLPVPTWGAVQPGDIKYKDENDDGVINTVDKAQIGRRSNPWSYGVNLKLKYKGLSFFVLGVGQSGGSSIKNGNYYWVDGNDKYSEVVLDRWTPETASTATYPRLSSGTNKNNFQTSSYWMYDNSFFDIRRAQITYEFSKNFCQKLKMKDLSVNVAGTNLVEFSKNKDIRQLNIGSNPKYRYFTLGLRTSF